MGVVEAPVAHQVGASEADDCSKTSHVCDPVQYGVPAPLDYIQVRIVLEREVELGSIFLLIAVALSLPDVEDCLVHLLGEVCKVEDTVLQDQVSLLNRHALRGGLVRVDPLPDDPTLLVHSVIIVAVSDESSLIDEQH